jgi:pilus assembly protein CpaB
MDIKSLGEGIRSRITAPIIMLVVAILIAALVSFWSYNLLKKKDVAGQGTFKTQDIVVAASGMKWGTVITADVVKTQPYLKESLPAGCIVTPATVIGRVVLYPIQINEPITETKLAPVDVKVGGMAAVVSPGKRAMAVKVDKVIGISGFIRPGHRVDVLVSLNKSDQDNVANTITKIVLENILVLAAGSEDEPPDKKEKPTMVDVITLEVTPEEGEKLALAATEGKLQLALRNYADTADIQTRGTTLQKLLSPYPNKDDVARPRTARMKSVSKPAPAAPFTVEVIKGSKISEEKFSRGGE